MTPLFHPQLVNDRFGDPGLYIECLFERRGLLFDLGDLVPLSSRKLLHVSHAFVSHTHMDHFAGFDQLLRVCLGREKRLRVFGPEGFIERVGHKLQAYSWNLVENFKEDFVIEATEVHSRSAGATAVFHTFDAFVPTDERDIAFHDGILIDEDGFRIRTAILDHRVPCLAFTLEEKQHVNVYKNRVEEMGLAVGPWLRALRQAVLRGDPGDKMVDVAWREPGEGRPSRLPLAELRDRVLRVAAGQKIAYAVDLAYTDTNVERLTALAENADILFIESPFLERDREIAAEKRHLTAHQAGTIARRARVRRVEPFHFSPRYSDEADHLAAEVEAAFKGKATASLATADFPSTNRD